MKSGRPILRYHGGKWRLAPWIIQHFPDHRVYVEPFGGAASVLLRKPRVYAEVYNDRDDEVVNVFQVLRSPARAQRLRERVALTPFARAEFRGAYRQAKDPVERARRTIARAFLGFGSASMSREYQTGFRFNSNRSGTTPAHDWVNWPEHIAGFVERLRGVVIENRPALEVVAAFDRPDALIYCDPPYVHSTRTAITNPNGNKGQSYRYEMTDDDHRQLAAALRAAVGFVVVSGYECPLYLELYKGWHTVEKSTHADGARPRNEVLWLSPRTADALYQCQPLLREAR